MKKYIKIGLVNIVVLLFVLGLLEIGLRLFWKMSSLKGEIYQASSNRILRYELKPNISTKYETYEVITNSDGFRGKEYSIDKPKDTYRIVIIGDSVAFGKFTDKNTLASRLELGLANFCSTKKFEVLNMGVEGYNSIQESEMLRLKGLKYNPDLVIVYYTLNDPDYPEYYCKKNFINHHFLLPRYIFYRIKKFQVKRDRAKRGVRNNLENFQYLYSHDTWQHAKEAILEMGNLTASKGIQMVLLITPEMSEDVKDFREGYPFWYINEMLENINHRNIIVIDPIREFSRRGLKKEELTHWAYPNLKANDIITEYIIKELQKKNVELCN